ncbi:MAG: tetratricopeptide repeat protein [Actinobacteria bacterium]|nr:tetratricopeptide repeat protein [Actinomycetota bacterium]
MAKYYKSRLPEPTVYVQEEGMWHSYGFGGLLKQKRGTIPEGILNYTDEISEDEAKDWIRLRVEEAERIAAARLTKARNNAAGQAPSIKQVIQQKARVVGAAALSFIAFTAAVFLMISFVEGESLDSILGGFGTTGFIALVVAPFTVGGFVFAMTWHSRPGWGDGALFGLGLAMLGYATSSARAGILVGLANALISGALAAALSGIGGVIAVAISRLLLAPSRATKARTLKPWHVAAILSVLLVFSAVAAGIVLFSEDDQEAQKEWNEAVRLAEEGQAAEEQGRVEEALALYSEAIMAEPGYVGGWSGKTTLLLEEGRFEAALGCAEGWTDSLPKNSSSWFYKGYALEGLGKYQEAIDAYETCILLDEANGRDTEETRDRRDQCHELLTNPDKIAEDEYFDTVASPMTKIYEADQLIEAVFDSESAEEALSLLTQYCSCLDDCLEDILAIEAPARLVPAHAVLTKGVQNLKAGALGISAALQSGDADAFDESSDTLLQGSDAVEAYRELMLDELSK